MPIYCQGVNPLNPHDALKHHFASLKKDLISWNLNEIFHGTVLKITVYFFICHSLEVIFIHIENCDSNSRLVVDEDDYGKFRLERVNC